MPKDDGTSQPASTSRSTNLTGIFRCLEIGRVREHESAGADESAQPFDDRGPRFVAKAALRRGRFENSEPLVRFLELASKLFAARVAARPNPERGDRDDHGDKSSGQILVVQKHPCREADGKPSRRQQKREFHE